MEENKKEGTFQNRRISLEKKNLVNLRQNSAAGNQRGGYVEPEDNFDAESFKAAAEPVRERGPINRKAESKRSGILDKLTEQGMYLLIFLMPLFILPFSVEAYEFNKSFLLVFGSVVLFFIWALDAIFIKKRIIFSKSLLTASFIFYLLALLASVFFSVDTPSSIWGYSGNFSDSFVFYAGTFIFYMVFVSLAAIKGAKRVITKSISALIYSALLASVAALPYYFGFTQLPGFGGAVAGFNPVSGYSHAFAIYLLVMLFVILYDFSSNGLGRARKIVDILAMLAIIVNIILIDWPVIYLMVFVLCVALVFFGGAREKEDVAHGVESVIPLMMIFSSLFFISSVNLNEIMVGKLSMGNSSSIGSMVREAAGINMSNLNTSVQNGFGLGEALKIANVSLSERPVLGSGLGTYYYDFFKYKSVDFNNSPNWTLGFNKAYNEILEKISTIGVLGVLAYCLLAVLAFLLVMKNAKTEKNGEFLMVAFLSLLLFQFLFFETSILKFLFVLFLAIASAGKLAAAADGKYANEIVSFDIQGKSMSGGVISVFGVIVILVCSTSMALGIQIFRAEAKYVSVINAGDPQSVDTADMEEVVRLNPYKGDYAAGISGIYLSRVRQLVNLNRDDQDTLNQITNEANSALTYAAKAVEVSPNNMLLWENYSYIYKSIDSLGMDGANKWAIKGYEKAIELAPNDPTLRTELSKLYLTQYEKDKNDEDKKADLEKAKAELIKSQELKSDYVDTALELALVYSYEKDGDKMLEQVDRASQMRGLSVVSAVEIGRLYYNAGAMDKAKNALLEVVSESVDPNNADAHYILGTIYKEEKKYAEALEEYKIVEKFNPDNKGLQEVIKEVENLIANNGKTSEDEDKKENASSKTPSSNTGDDVFADMESEDNAENADE
jgi:tetratricopeptide (TPR) repeat protein